MEGGGYGEFKKIDRVSVEMEPLSLNWDDNNNDDSMAEH